MQIEIFTKNGEEQLEKMERCGILSLEQGWKQHFFLGMYAQSQLDSFFQIDLSNLIYQSDTESKGLVPFTQNSELQMPKIFKKINLMLANSHLLNEHSPSENITDLNISSISKHQAKSLQRLDIVNHLLALNLEQSDEILSYFGQQQELTALHFDAIITALESWIGESSQQVVAISQDASVLMKELKSVDLAKFYKRTQKAIIDLESSLKLSAPTLEHFQHLTNKTKNNMKFLQKKQLSLHTLPRLLSSHLRQSLSKKHEKHKIMFLSVLSFIGLIVIVSLTSILLRLKMTQRRKLFE